MSNKDFGEVKPTILYPRNYDVDRINKLESEKLVASGAKKETYLVNYSKCKNKESAKNYIKSLDIPESITFCVGDQVVVTANVDQDNGIVNGTRGVIEDLDCDCVTIKKTNGKILKIRYFKTLNPDFPDIKIMPLKLAYALSIHKSQGMTLDAVEVDIGPKIFAAGQAYTALSRAQNLESVKVKSIAQKSFIIDPEVLKFYKNIEKGIENKKYIYEKLNLLIYNISNHIQLDKSLDIVWDLIPEEDTELLEYFNEYNQPKVELELKNYQDNKCTELIRKIYKIKKYIDIDFFKSKINELN
jgi:hypothetical protein